jgi:hypothetical protein
MDLVIGVVTKNRRSEVAIIEFGTVAISIMWWGMIAVVSPRGYRHDRGGK